MSKKMNLKSMKLENINNYLIACKKLQVEDTRYREELKPLQEKLDMATGKKVEHTKAEKDTANIDLIIASHENKIEECKNSHKDIAKGIRAEVSAVTRLFCPKGDEFYEHYASIDGSDDFAKDVLEILTSLGAKVNDEKRACKQVAHITGWKMDKKSRCMKPVARVSFINMIALGITTMLTSGDKPICKMQEDGSLIFTRDIEQ